MDKQNANTLTENRKSFIRMREREIYRERKIAKERKNESEKEINIIA